MLGKRQKETLESMAKSLNAEPEGLKIQVNIHRQRPYTRELGGGIAVSVAFYDTTTDKEVKMENRWLSDCANDSTAIEKGREIARHLVNVLGCPKDRIRIRRVESRL